MLTPPSRAFYGKAPYALAGLLFEENAMAHPVIFKTMLSKNLVEVGDLVIFTKGDLAGVSGGTNAMKILKVTAAE